MAGCSEGPTTRRLDIADVGVTDPTLAWREVMARAYVPFDAVARPAPGTAFRASVTRHALGAMALVETAHGPGSGRRGRAERSGPSGDLLGVMLMRRGAQALTFAGTTTVLRAGEALVWDGSAEGAFEAPAPMAKHTLVVSRERMRAEFPRYAEVLGRPLPAAHPQVRILAGFLETVAAVAPSLDADAAEAAGDALLAALRAACGAGLPAGSAGLAELLLERVQRHIDAHLADPGLGPASIAAAHAVSLRTLHRTFAPTGESVSARIRRRRLERCHRELSEGHGPVTTVALRWGFPDAAHFSRAFRAAFGTSAREVLRAAREQAGADGQRRGAPGQDRPAGGA